MIFGEMPEPRGPLRQTIDAPTRADEQACVQALLAELELDGDVQGRIESTARQLVETVRGERHRPGGIDAFLAEYGLSTQEGVMLMCIAEARDLLEEPARSSSGRPPATASARRRPAARTTCIAS